MPFCREVALLCPVRVRNRCDVTHSVTLTFRPIAAQLPQISIPLQVPLLPSKYFFWVQTDIIGCSERGKEAHCQSRFATSETRSFTKMSRKVGRRESATSGLSGVS